MSVLPSLSERGPAHTRIRVGAAAASALALTLALSSCTSSHRQPVVTDAPATTAATVRVAALTGDADAAATARAAVLALNNHGIEAKLVTRDGGWSAETALSSLESGDLDYVLGGGAVLGDHAVRDAQSRASASPSATATDAGTQPSASGSAVPGTPLTGADAVTAQVSGALPDGTVVASTALTSRMWQLVTTKSYATYEKLGKIGGAELSTSCATASLATPGYWDEDFGKSWRITAGCDAKSELSVGTSQEALDALQDGRAQLAIVSSTEPAITDWDLNPVADGADSLSADPLLGLASSDRVGQDALSVLAKVAGAVSGSDFQQLRRVTDGEDADAQNEDTEEWLVKQGVDSAIASAPASSDEG